MEELPFSLCFLWITFSVSSICNYFVINCRERPTKTGSFQFNEKAVGSFWLPVQARKLAQGEQDGLELPQSTEECFVDVRNWKAQLQSFRERREALVAAVAVLEDAIAGSRAEVRPC